MIKFLKQQLGHDVHPMVQFIKYGFVGGLATGINIIVTFYLGWRFFPCLTENDSLVRLFGLTVVPPEESVRWLRAAYCSAIGFVISNTVCYVLNRWFVFKPGRHRMAVEFVLFFGVSGLSWAIGTVLQSVLIKFYGIESSAAIGLNIICAVLINYALRKFVVFKG